MLSSIWRWFGLGRQRTISAPTLDRTATPIAADTREYRTTASSDSSSAGPQTGSTEPAPAPMLAPPHAAPTVVGTPPVALPTPRPQAAPAFRKPIASWSLRLHDVDPAEVAGLDVDLAVVDSASDGATAAVFRATDVRLMQSRPRGGQLGDHAANPRQDHKFVLAYLGIGEAESFRDYWRPEWGDAAGRPSWLGEANPDWDDTYMVRYWEPGWQNLLFGQPGAMLDRILAAGFDGVYLDIVDAFEAYETTRPTARADMIALVTALAAHARRSRPDFLVVVQNAEALLVSDTYRAVLSAIAKEDLYYGLRADEQPNAAPVTAKSLEYLALARRDGIGVLVAEYLGDAGKMAHVRREAAALGDALCVVPV